jgi:murein DD-endopeptidase MepM/ murein hydrolase activator NlpD
VEVMYAMLDSIDVKAGQFVKRGQRIGTLGNAGGFYSVANHAGAHLHWEVRQTVGMGLGPAFDTRHDGWLGPSDFITAHRGNRAKQPLLPKVLNDADRPGWGTDY